MLLKYQQQFLQSNSKVKVWRKSRRIGATYAIALDSCLTAGRYDNPYDVWVSSSDMQASKEFIRYCEEFAIKLNNGAKSLGEQLLEDEKDITALVIEFITKKRIMALSSSARSFRSKGGSVILDEFAFHDNSRELWKAATPVTRWGGNIQALSSVSTENNFFEEICDQAKSNKSFYFQQTTIIDAINDGIVDKILRKKATLKDKDNFLAEIRDECLSEESFLQEYMCIPQSSDGEYWLSWELITGVESKEVLIDGSTYKKGKTIIGHDIAIRGDNSVFVVFELIGDVAHLVDLRVLKNKKFAEQEQVLKELVKVYNPYRIYVDQTGMGEKVVEDYKRLFGSVRVQGVLFNNATKQDMAVNAKQIFEDKKLRLPFANEQIRGDLRKIKKELGAGNIPKFTTERDKNGHGDIAWAIFLALLGLKNKIEKYEYKAIPRKGSINLRKIKGCF